MENLVNRPKVFLSHSSLDKPFINRLNDDLRKCRIDTWLDTEEIRDGRSWMKVIFQDGIPACDAILVYLTPNSVKSKMVEKEMDAALLSQLESGGVVVLPYVSSVDVRNQLRLDLRSLHCRQWAEDNYHDIIPSVVAEIWHSYLERNIGLAVLTERNRRLELELELNKLKEQYKDEVFSQQEEKEFQFTRQELERHFNATVGVYPKANDDRHSNYQPIGEDIFKIPIIRLFVTLLQQGHSHIVGDSNDVKMAVIFILINAGYPEKIHDNARTYDPYQIHIPPNILTRLLTYGLLRPPVHSETETSVYTYYYFSEKAFRFLYWLKYNGHDKNLPKVEFVEHVSEQEKRRRMGF